MRHLYALAAPSWCAPLKMHSLVATEGQLVSPALSLSTFTYSHFIPWAKDIPSPRASEKNHCVLSFKKNTYHLRSASTLSGRSGRSTHTAQENVVLPSLFLPQVALPSRFSSWAHFLSPYSCGDLGLATSMIVVVDPKAEDADNVGLAVSNSGAADPAASLWALACAPHSLTESQAEEENTSTRRLTTQFRLSPLSSSCLPPNAKLNLSFSTLWPFFALDLLRFETLPFPFWCSLASSSSTSPFYGNDFSPRVVWFLSYELTCRFLFYSNRSGSFFSQDPIVMIS